MIAAIRVQEKHSLSATEHLLCDGSVGYMVIMPAPASASWVYLHSRLDQNTGMTTYYGFTDLLDWQLARHLQTLDGISLRLACLTVQAVGHTGIYRAATAGDVKSLTGKVAGLGPTRAKAIMACVQKSDAVTVTDSETATAIGLLALLGHTVAPGDAALVGLTAQDKVTNYLRKVQLA